MQTRLSCLTVFLTLLAFASCGGNDEIPPQQGGVVSTSETPAPSDKTPAQSTPFQPWLIGEDEPLKPGLLVANFASDTDDGLPWGVVFSQLLQVKLHYAPGELFSMPLSGFLYDEYRHLHGLDTCTSITHSFSPDDAVRIARVFGLQRTVTGELEKRGDNLVLAVQLRDAGSSKVLTRFTLESAVAKTPQMLAECCRRIVDGFEIDAEKSVRERLARPTPKTGELVRRTVSTYADEPTSKALAAAVWKSLYEEDAGFDLAKVLSINILAQFAPERARTEAKRLHEADPQNGRLWYLYIAELELCKRYADVIRECTGFLRKNPNDLWALWRLGRAYEKIGNHKEAMATGLRLVALQPDSWHTRLFLAKAYAAHGWQERGGGYYRDVPLPARSIFPTMMERCLEELARAARINPNSPDVFAQLAQCYVTLGYPEEAVEAACRRAIEIEPDNWEAHQTLVWYYKPGWSRQHGKAIDFCREAAERHPNTPQMQWLMAHYLLWYIEGNRSQTGISYERFLKMPGFTDLIEESIEKTMALGYWVPECSVQAAKFYTDMAKQDPIYYEKAWEQYERIGDYIPNMYRKPVGEHEWWRIKAMAAMRVKRWDDAIRFATTGLSKSPCANCHHDLAMAMAMAYEKKKDYDKALLYYIHVAETPGEHKGWALTNYAHIVITHRPKLIDSGFQYAQRAIAERPADCRTRITMARYHYKRGEREEARAQIQAALMIDATSTPALKLKTQIEAMKP